MNKYILLDRYMFKKMMYMYIYIIELHCLPGGRISRMSIGNMQTSYIYDGLFQQKKHVSVISTFAETRKSNLMLA